MDTKVSDISSVVLKIASPDKILSWSRGEVTKPETINYRTQRPERNGLFCEKIFGPDKDYECYCGKYKKIRYKGIVCEKCGVEVTNSIVRRERMGHIALAAPVSHIWFLKGLPSRIGTFLDIKSTDLDKIIYFAGYIITKVVESERTTSYKNLELEYKDKLKNIKTKEEKALLKKLMLKAKNELDSIVPHRVLTEEDYYDLSMKYGGAFEAETGAESIYNILKNINLDEFLKKTEDLSVGATGQDKIKIMARINLVKSMRKSGIRPEWMFLTILPVIPPSLRPMVALDGGRNATSDLNDLYRRVINRNNRLKKLVEIKAPEIICRNEKRILQEAVDALIDNTMRHTQNAAMAQGRRRPLKSLAEMLRGKQGRFRQNLLGKRVDFSGRSVIVVGPELKMNQCGLPKHMALELFRPFVIAQLIKTEMAYNIRRANHLIDDKIPEVWAILEEIIKNKMVLLNRAPTLHRLSIQAFQPVLIDGKAIQLHPLVCHAFNADFDGDQMAVHVPLTSEAQTEAREIMSSVKNLLRPGNGEPIVGPTQDIILGCYWLTKMDTGKEGECLHFSSPDEAVLAKTFDRVNIRSKIKILPGSEEKYKFFNNEIFETTVGRIMLNSILPSDYPYINNEVNKKSITALIANILEKYGNDICVKVLDDIKKLGFRYATVSGISWGYQDIKIPENKKNILKAAEKEALKVKNQYQDGLFTDTERYNKIIEIWQGAKDEIEDLVPETIDKMGPVYSMVDSGAKGSLVQLGQMTGMKGLVVNPGGNIIDFPIKSNYKEGLGILEYFITTHGARKGEVDTALKTSKAGYLTRKLVDVAHDVVVMEEDCGEENGIVTFKKETENYGKKFSAKIFGRTLSSKEGRFDKGHLLSLDDAKELEKDKEIEKINIFSPITCKSRRGVCQKCYGYDLSFNNAIKLGEAVGVIAAQAIGEPGTQLTMKTFHKGGIATGSDITMGLLRIEEIFELRIPKNPAVICDVDGEVLEIKQVDHSAETEVGTTNKIVTILADNGSSEIAQGSKDFNIPFGRFVTVKKGDKLKRGDVLTDGSLDIHDYFKIAGKEKVQAYILKEIDKVYLMQGASINEKHIEIIIRQMFSRYKIVDTGETDLNQNEIIDYERSVEYAKQGVKLEQIIMPINKVALSTDSFLSAASFQDTPRVLIKTAISGRSDNLKGLKENVILGRLIPAGTGFKKGVK